MGLSEQELEVLRCVKEMGGQATAQPVAEKVEMEINDVRVLLKSLARMDFLHLKWGGTCYLSKKGKDALEG